MAFWDSTSIEPKRQFRFKVEFGLLKAGTSNSDTYLAQAADRPSYTIKGDTAVHFLDKQFFFPGKVTWNQVKIRFVDAESADGINVASRSWDYLRATGWVNPTTMAGGLDTFSNLQTVSKSGANIARGEKEVRVHVLGAGGESIDKWTLKNAFITNVALNNLDYAQDGILTAEYTFVYDWAEYGP